jgi:hypothetical protein
MQPAFDTEFQASSSAPEKERDAFHFGDGRSWTSLAAFLPALISLLITCWASLHFPWTHDDLMNIHWAISTSWQQLLGDIFCFWRTSPVYRPSAIFVWKAAYSAFGMNLLAWKLLYAVMVTLAVLLVAAWILRVTRNPTAAFLAGLLMSYHPSLSYIYFSMGFFYDTLSMLGVLSLALLYPTARSAGGGRTAAYIALLVVTLGFKESVVFLAPLLVLYELVVASERKWLLAGLVSVTCAIFAIGRMVDPASLARNHPRYQPTFEVRSFVEHIGYWSLELFSPHEPSPESLLRAGTVALLVIAALLALFVWRKQRVLAWLLLSAIAGVLPLAFIAQRGLDSIVLSLVALFAVASALVAWAIERMEPRWRWPIAGTLALLIVLWQGGPEQRAYRFSMRDVDWAIEGVIQQTRSLRPPPKPGERFIIETDPFEEMQWADVFIFRAVWGSPQLEVYRRKQFKDLKLTPEPGDRVLQWEKGRWVQVAQSRRATF